MPLDDLRARSGVFNLILCLFISTLPDHASKTTLAKQLVFGAILANEMTTIGRDMVSATPSRNYKFGVTFAACILIALAFSGLIDKTGQQYTEDAFKRALVTFGVARGLNAAISVAQGTEISFTPVGVGLTLTPGEILDPVNDLIERFSWVMLMSSTSLGIQQIFLNISSSMGASIVVSIIVLLALFLLWRPQLAGPNIQQLVSKLALMLLILRFTVPVAAIGSEWVYSYFLSDQYQESKTLLEDTTSEIADLNKANQQVDPETGETWVPEWATQLWDSTTESLDVEARMEGYKQATTKAIDHTIDLIVVFVIQTILLPLIFLWLMVRFIRNVWD